MDGSGGLRAVCDEGSQGVSDSAYFSEPLLWLAVIVGVTAFSLACLIFVMLVRASSQDRDGGGQL